MGIYTWKISNVKDMKKIFVKELLRIYWANACKKCFFFPLDFLYENILYENQRKISSKNIQIIPIIFHTFPHEIQNFIDFHTFYIKISIIKATTREELFVHIFPFSMTTLKVRWGMSDSWELSMCTSSIFQSSAHCFVLTFITQS